MKRTVKFLTTLAFSGIALINSAIAEPLTPSDWYLHLDVKGMQNSALNLVVENEQEFKPIQLVNLVFGKEAADDIQFATFYGDIDENHKNKILHLQGDFTTSRSALVNEWRALGLEAVGSDIYHVKADQLIKALHAKALKSGLIDEPLGNDLNDKDLSDVSIYASITTDHDILISDSREMIQQWQPGQSNQQKTPKGLFEVVVDVEKALMHAGVNLDENGNQINFESISARQLSQVSVSYDENGTDSTLQLGLSAKTTQTASQVKMVVQGLIALRSLQESSPAIKNMLSTIQFEQNAGDLLVTISGTTEAFKALIKSHND